MQRALILATGNVIEPAVLHLTSVPPVENRSAEAPPAPAAHAPTKSSHLEDLERDHILATLAAVGGSRKLARERLGLAERTLRNKLQQYREAGFLSEK